MRRMTSTWLSAVSRLGFRRSRCRSSARASRRVVGNYTRQLGSELLEERCVLSASLPSIDEVTTIEWQGLQVDVAKDQWLVTLDNLPTTDFLTSLAIEFGSGATWFDVDPLSYQGLIVAPDAEVGQIELWAQGQAEVQHYEPNFITSVSVFPDDQVFTNESSVDGLWGLNNDSQVQIQWIPLLQNGPDQGVFVGNGFYGTNDADIDAPEAWEVATGSRNVVVGVIDTGIDYAHPDLYLNIWINQGEIPSLLAQQLTDVDLDGQITFVDLNDAANASFVTERSDDGVWNDYIDAGDILVDPLWEDTVDLDDNGFVDDLFGWDFVSNDNDPRDDHFHGTHVAGTIGAIGNNEYGVAGVNWNVLIAPIKFLDRLGFGAAGGAVQSVDYATSLRRDAGVNLVATNNSWGGSAFSQSLMNAIERANDADVLFAAAAGNDGTNNDSLPHYPSTYSNDNIIAVAASDAGDQLAEFSIGGSNYGAQSVDLAAPGRRILSTFPTYLTGEMQSRGLTTFFESISGTSMATPHVTGAAALLAAYSPVSTAAEIRDAILDGVDQLTALAGKTVTGGRLNLVGALAAIPTTSILTVSTAVDENDGNYSAGDLSLREALALATSQTTGRDLIRFDEALSGSTIVLSQSLGQLVVNSEVIIEGLGADQLTIDANDKSRVFQINAGVTAIIDDLTISGGYAFSGTTVGGGVLNRGNLTLDRVVVEDNVSMFGGGIGQDLASASLTIVDSTIRDNLAATGGGGINSTAGSVEIVSSTISNNSAAIYAGGLRIGTNGVVSSLIMTNSTVSGNLRGGIQVYGGTNTTVDILNSTITLNTPPLPGPAPAEGGGIVSFGLVTLRNTIVAGNSSGDIKGNFVSTSAHNLIGEVRSTVSIVNGVNGNQVGTQAAPIAPLLGPLADNGGPTATHALLVGSPAINQGNNAAAASLLSDQRGVPRIIDVAVDIGAVESIPELIVDTTVDELDNDYGENDFSLREALALAKITPGELADLIQFDPSLSASTITLNDSLRELAVEADVVIEGLGQSELTIVAARKSRVFQIYVGVEATIRGLTLANGDQTPPSFPPLVEVDPFHGAGIYNRGDLTLEESTITGNTGQLQGGAIAQTDSGASLVVRRSTIKDNFANDGAAIFASAGSVRIESSAVFANTSSSGVVDISGTASLVMVNSTVSGNVGIGINVRSGASAEIIQSTITKNTTFGFGYYGAGIGNAGTLTIHNSIVAGNAIPGEFDPGFDIAGAVDPGSSHNLIGVDLGGTFSNSVLGNIVIGIADPRLAPLGYYGGPTMTHALLFDSLAIDAGDNGIAELYDLDYDQRGENRIVDWDEDVDARIDIGAVELALEELYT